MTRMAQRLDAARTGRQAADLERSLSRLVVGQQEAVREIVSMYQMYLTGLNAPGRPLANFLFLGPTGTGKTRIVEATAESLLGSARAVIKVDCGEFQHSHEIAKLIGSPPGYLGHRETHPMLSQEVLDQFHTEDVQITFVLFDEVEKASDALWNLLLGILDKATLTLGDNRRVDFSRAMVFLTSNLGACEMSSILSPKVGFGAHLPAVSTATPALTGKIARAGAEAARRKFTPEFVNRLDKIVVFQPLGEEELGKILDIELGFVQRRVFSSANAQSRFVFRVSDRARRHLLASGTDVKYGARHLKRAIERLLVQPISNLVASEQIRGGDLIRVDYDAAGDALTFVREGHGLELHEMTKLADFETLPSPRVAAAARAETRRARPASGRG